MTDRRTDEELLAACRAGETSAFAELVRRYQVMACAVTYSATGSRALSEELAQEAFVLAWQRLGQLEDDARFGPWLGGVARNLARNAKRKARREVATADFETHRAREPTMADQLDDAREEAMLWEALEEIPETYREPLVLFYREGQSTKQVADALGLSTSAVEQRLSRGRKRLREGVRHQVAAGLARGAVPAAGFVAAVMTSIAALPAHAAGTGADPGPPPEPQAMGASTSAATPSWLLLAAAMVGTALLGLAAVVVTRDRTGSDADARAQAQEGEEPSFSQHETRASSTRQGHGRIRRERARQRAASRKAPPAVPRYELSLVSPVRVAVNLEGGESDVVAAPYRTMAESRVTTRTWTGHVRDTDGAPVAGAVVVAGSRLGNRSGVSVTAEYGATTNAAGAFSIALGTSEALNTFALADSNHWSAFTLVPAGSEDLTLDLEVERTATLVGQLRRGDEPIAGRVTAVPVPGCSLSFMTGTDGHFEVSLPPGTYEVVGSDAETIFELNTPSTRATLELPAGIVTEHDFALPVGALLAFDVQPPDEPFDTITYTMVVGRHEFENALELMAAHDELDPEQTRRILHGGLDLDDPAQFADMPRGWATACIEVARRAPSGERVDLHFDCKQVELGEPGSVAPVEFSWD